MESLGEAGVNKLGSSWGQRPGREGRARGRPRWLSGGAARPGRWHGGSRSPPLRRPALRYQVYLPAPCKGFIRSRPSAGAGRGRARNWQGVSPLFSEGLETNRARSPSPEATVPWGLGDAVSCYWPWIPAPPLPQAFTQLIKPTPAWNWGPSLPKKMRAPMVSCLGGGASGLGVGAVFRWVWVIASERGSLRMWPPDVDAPLAGGHQVWDTRRWISVGVVSVWVLAWVGWEAALPETGPQERGGSKQRFAPPRSCAAFPSQTRTPGWAPGADCLGLHLLPPRLGLATGASSGLSWCTSWPALSASSQLSLFLWFRNHKGA